MTVTSNQRRLPARGRAPECVGISMANGQQPTDILRRETAPIGGIGFGRPLRAHQRVGRTNGQRRRADGTVVKGVPRRDSAVAVSVGGGSRIDGANLGHRLDRLGSDWVGKTATSTPPQVRRSHVRLRVGT